MKNIPKKAPIRLFVTILLIFPHSSTAGICKSVASEFYFAKEQSVKHSFFDAYFISKKYGSYYIYAVKTVPENYTKLIKVLRDFSSYPKFMLGYRAIKVKKITSNKLLTSIIFKPPLSPFDSKFTNEVEIISSEKYYQQCWLQLQENDPRISIPFEYAPKRNEGYWSLENLSNNNSKLSYHSIIKPPIPLPLIAYRFFAKNSYVDTFQRIINRSKEDIK